MKYIVQDENGSAFAKFNEFQEAKAYADDLKKTWRGNYIVCKLEEVYCTNNPAANNRY